jgi:DNA-binding response OmpR family regulator
MRVLITETTFPAMALANDMAARGLLVTRAGDAEDALAFAEHAPQDVALIEGDLPDHRPADLIRLLRRRHPGLALILVAPSGDLGMKLAGFEAGADDVVPPSMPAAEIAARAEAIVRRYRGRAGAELRLGDLTLDLSARRARVGKTVLPLARLEFALVEFMAQRMGQVVSRDQIMAHLYGLDDSPDSRVITAYICHIRGKIEAAGGDGSVIRNHWGRGYSIAVPQAAGLPVEAPEAIVAQLAA